MRFSLILCALCLLMFASCGTTNIKGTEIPDTKENRAVLDVFGSYVKALQDKKPEKVLELVSENYYDYNGTEEAADDVDASGIKSFIMSEEFKKILKIDIIIIMKDIQVSEETAKVLYYYEARFKKHTDLVSDEESVLKQGNEKWLKVNDLNQMIFKKEKESWKIISGL